MIKIKEINKNFDRGEYPSEWKKNQLIKKCFEQIPKQLACFVAQVNGDTHDKDKGEIGTIVLSQANNYLIENGEMFLSSHDQSLEQYWFAICSDMSVRLVHTSFGESLDGYSRLQKMNVNNKTHYVFVKSEPEKQIEGHDQQLFHSNERLTPKFGVILTPHEIIDQMFNGHSPE